MPKTQRHYTCLISGRQPACPFKDARPFSTASAVLRDATQAPTESSDVAREVLRNISVRDLCSSLKAQSATQPVLSVDELLAQIEQQGCASSPSEAARVMDALHTSGIILRHKQIVYLDPVDVEDRVLRVLPDTRVAEVRPTIAWYWGARSRQD